ncbi:hypothetical protein [Microcoleus sp. herbarium12]|uniref:hypothetical protein n=1 Tax=Microcoleus sp. herbarium12 TaxID=3055437 RepID=UPI002FD1C350
MNKKIASPEFPEDKDPLFILLRAAVSAGVSAGIYVTVYFADLTAQIILSWFRNFAYLLVENDRRSFQETEYVGFVICQPMDSGGYKIFQGIFDTKNSRIYDARVIQANSVAPTIKNGISFWK